MIAGGAAYSAKVNEAKVINVGQRMMCVEADEWLKIGRHHATRPSEDGRGWRTTYVYDADGRPTVRRFNDGTRVTQTFDAASQRLVLNDTTGRTTATFDAAGQTSTVSRMVASTLHRLTYSFDGRSRRSIGIRPSDPTTKSG